MVLNRQPKRVSESAKMTYLDSIIHLHINYDLILAQKTAFLIALSALILTISVGLMFHNSFESFPPLIKLAVIIVPLSNVFGVLTLFSAENFKPSRIVSSFHPLSIGEFREENKRSFKNDLERLLSKEESMIEDYSNQILSMKEDMYNKTRIIKLSRKFIILPLFVSTVLVAIQLAIFLF
jgi:hypothetical protein